MGKLNTVNALLVPAVTIFLGPLEVRVLIKRGYYSRAVTISNFDFSTLKNYVKPHHFDDFVSKIDENMVKIHCFDETFVKIT